MKNIFVLILLIFIISCSEKSADPVDTEYVRVTGTEFHAGYTEVYYVLVPHNYTIGKHTYTTWTNERRERFIPPKFIVGFSCELHNDSFFVDNEKLFLQINGDSNIKKGTIMFYLEKSTFEKTFPAHHLDGTIVLVPPEGVKDKEE